MEADKEKERQLIAMNGGVELEITRNVNGVPVTETVKVRQVPMRQLDKLSRAWTSEESLIRLVTEKDDAWLDTLTEDAWAAIAEKGRELNFTRVSGYTKRHSNMMSALGINLNELVKEAVTKETASQGNPTSQESSNS